MTSLSWLAKATARESEISHRSANQASETLLRRASCARVCGNAPERVLSVPSGGFTVAVWVDEDGATVRTAMGERMQRRCPAIRFCAGWPEGRRARPCG